jgi:hypothetical protein
MGVVALVLRLAPRPIVAAAALILAVAVLVLQLGLVVSAVRPGYGTLAVGAVAVWAAIRAWQALVALRQWPAEPGRSRREASAPDVLLR